MKTTDIAVIRPRGRLDAAGAPGLERELQQRLGGARPHLLVDLSETTYISSNGLRVLLAACKSARRAGGWLRLCCLGPRLVEIFEMVGFDQVFDIYATREDAEQAAQGETTGQ